MSYEIGSRVGDYEIVKQLGEGGMGRVFKVRNVISDRIEAMKVLLPDLESNPGFAERFMREIKLQASLDHPNIAALHTALRIDNQLLMMMEFVEGVTLEKMMEAGRVPIDKAVDYIAQVLSALAYAHGRGVIHRDVKPANMMIMANGLVKLMDFGIAKGQTDHKITQTGSIVGSLYYISPEQIRGMVDLDPRSDLYSVGVTLYEVVTGARPFQGDSGYSIMAAHLQNIPSPPTKFSPDLPSGLSEIILQALEKDPARRFQTAEEFRRALLSVCKPGQGAAPVPHAYAKAAPAPPPPPVPDGGTQPQPDIPPRIPPQPVHGRRGLWIAIGALLTVAVIVVAATQVPKILRTLAKDTSTVETPATQPVVTPPAQPSTTPTVPESSSVQNPVESPAPATPSARAQGTPQTQAPATTHENVASVPPNTTPRAPVQPRHSGTSRRPGPEAASPAPKQTASSPQEGAGMPRPERVQPAQQSAAPAGNALTAELNYIQEQLDLLKVRAGTVKSGMETLRGQLAASGLGLRADMANAASRMELYLGQTQTALNRRDKAAAKRNLDLAETEVTKLEDWQGR